jgi:type I restriction enzyme M protein
MDKTYNQIVSLIWSIADDILRDVFLRGQYRDVILPMVVLRRLDALLEPTKEAVEEELQEQRDAGLDIIDEDALKDITGLSYFNTSKWTLSRLKSHATDDNKILLDNFNEYLAGFSDNVKDVLKNFEYYAKAEKLANNDRLLSMIERITDPRINLTDKPASDPDGLPLPPLTNHGMGTVFEELLRRFNEENNEEAGEHFTPRDAISLLAHLVFEPVGDNLPKVISIYDPAEGSGGMLSESREFLLKRGVNSSAIQLFGTEINPETYAICKSDLIIKGVDPGGMHLGNTITENNFAGQSFGYMITNPPYGKSWKEDQKKLYHDKALIDHRYELQLPNFAGEMETVDATPASSDGQLLFMLEMIDKMKPLEYQPQGSRIASIHNGSSLFTGDAGSGASSIRRHVIENDLVEAIIQLPNNIFYNTGITTFVWLLTNNKAANRRGKVQLIDASQAFEKLRKNQGQRNCTITPKDIKDITSTYIDFIERETDQDVRVTSKIFDNDDFRYHSVTVERPLRLRCQFNDEAIDNLLFDGSQFDVSTWLYGKYGEQVFDGLEAHRTAIKEALQDQDIKLTDKKLDALIAKKKWLERQQLREAALLLHQAIGDEVYIDYNVFFEKIKETARELKKAGQLDLSATQLQTIARAMSMPDPAAAPVIDKEIKANAKDLTKFMMTYDINEDQLAHYGYYLTERGTYITYESDSALRDTEKIPVKEDILAFFKREVVPYVPDAWINLPATKIGCEISFNKYFYRPMPLRSLEENTADILALEKESAGAIQSLLNLLDK